MGAGFMKNRYISSALAVLAICFFAFYEVNGKPAGLALWGLFGTTNQLLAGLALLTITLYLVQRGKPWYFTGIPMVFLLVTTLYAMTTNVEVFYTKGAWPLFFVGTFLLIMGLWLVVEAGLAIRRYRESGVTDDLDITL